MVCVGNPPFDSVKYLVQPARKLKMKTIMEGHRKRVGKCKLCTVAEDFSNLDLLPALEWKWCWVGKVLGSSLKYIIHTSR